MQLISGTKIAQNKLKFDLKPRVQNLTKKNITPKLVVILIGDSPASKSYIKQKEKFAKKSEILSEVIYHESSISEKDLLSQIKQLNEDTSVHGIIVQLPIPPHISISKVLNAIDPAKDVDGFSSENIGKLTLGEPCLPPCTPQGIIYMIEDACGDISGKKLVVIGRSNIVGKPFSLMALKKNATICICHSQTKNITEELKDADIIVVAVGKPKYLTADMVPENSTIIDVGIHRQDDDTLCGDVDFENVSKKSAKISPVPGGIGPMTVYCLIENTITAAENSLR